MLLNTIIFGLMATATAATTIPESLKARIPAGMTYTTIAPEDIPESIKGAGKSVNSTVTEARDIKKRADFGVYLCTDANWGGHCVHIVAPENVCVPLAGDLNDQVSSVGPDSGAYCRFYFNAGCTDDNGCLHFDLTSPGYSNLNQGSLFVCGANNPNDKVTSYMCWSG
ncbi:uncharacterized protein BCR38DRAFT_438365 [Pseudomassariella vexata]|uniref:Uncharacterized protein n=1 Tax=Pseudomassariella vexata TaxID=1141098 RepID=A0A1Y2DT17_9PEZI|nr:uncharacterized protein BCR38DRAFT_438365 [Pseudomassariella vexata]ORY62397.1 hypothetical protein BCR38DRAFT_438365 [Pseudomassariella vexata]